MDAAESLFEELKQGGLAHVRSLVAERRLEDALLDFKTISPGCPPMQSPDLNNLASAISGFSNADGGVIVWGVLAKEGKSPKPSRSAVGAQPILELERFVLELQRRTALVTAPMVTGVLHLKIEEEPGADRGFVVTFVPKGEGEPVQRRDDSRYYVRIGDSFMPMPHSMVAAAFSRRLRPGIEFSCVVLRGGTSSGPEHHERHLTLVFGIRNVGRGLARDLAMKLVLDGTPRFALEFSYGPLALSRSLTVGLSGAPETYLYRGASGEVVHPGTTLDVERAEYRAPFDAQEFQDLSMRYAIYCDGAQAEGVFRVSGDELLAARGSPP